MVVDKSLSQPIKYLKYNTSTAAKQRQERKARDGWKMLRRKGIEIDGGNNVRQEEKSQLCETIYCAGTSKTADGES